MALARWALRSGETTNVVAPVTTVPSAVVIRTPTVCDPTVAKRSVVPTPVPPGVLYVPPPVRPH